MPLGLAFVLQAFVAALLACGCFAGAPSLEYGYYRRKALNLLGVLSSVAAVLLISLAIWVSVA